MHVPFIDREALLALVGEFEYVLED